MANYNSFDYDVSVKLNKFKDCPGQKLCSKCAWYVRNNGYFHVALTIKNILLDKTV